ncbi:hypothetical protein RDV64_08960 [Acuticoccus sp. MNP-M23]|uniref:hypothetical protein n=1 Tax=Acuticoccus sp. MNP-M23 TaxID=3072793 RepID=UPI0028162CEB|nr:hypothetical protein [Acuticoccus sp. MNP-M23]WMS44500.1 hypothetical protein RDV64_08960 [Acuticoccus sp. MNP-M23]
MTQTSADERRAIDAMRLLGRLFICLIAATHCTGPAVAQGNFSLADSEIVLKSRSGTGATVTRTVILSATGVPGVPEAAIPTVTVLSAGLSHAPEITAGTPIPIGAQAGTQRKWALPLIFAPGDQGVDAHERVLSVSLPVSGGTSLTGGIVLTVAVKSAFSWQIIDRDLGKFALGGANDPIPITIRVGPVEATNVRALPNFPQAAGTNGQGVHVLRLCRIDDDGVLQSCGSALTLEGGAIHRLGLAARDAAPLIGTFAGGITLISDQDPAGLIVSRSFDATTLQAKIFGSVAILIGVVVAFLLTAIVRVRMNRARALLPVAELLQRLDAIEDRLRGAIDTINVKTETPEAAPIANTLRMLERIRDHLQPSRLEKHGLPSVWDFGGESGEKETQLKVAIDKGADWTEVALVLIADGFDAVAQEASRERIEGIRRAVEALEELAGNALPSSSDLPAAPAIDTWHRTVAEAVAPAMSSVDATEEAHRVRQRRPLTRELLTVEIQHLSIVTWTIYLLLTWGLGTYLLVLSDSTFGSGRDYLECLLWGFGLPLAGQQLTNTTRPNVATALGITLPSIRPS